MPALVKYLTTDALRGWLFTASVAAKALPYVVTRIDYTPASNDEAGKILIELKANAKGTLKAPSVARNRELIAEVSRSTLPATGVVPEIASGSGEHAAFFAEQFPHHVFCPSDPDMAARRSIAAWAQSLGLANLRAPLALDAAQDVWPIAHADAMICIDMIHISPWSATEGLFQGAAIILATSSHASVRGEYGVFLALAGAGRTNDA